MKSIKTMNIELGFDRTIFSFWVKKLSICITFLSILVLLLNNTSSAQQTSKNNYTGAWTTSTSWTPTWGTPITTGIAQNITIYGYISHTGNISFGGAGGDLIIYDTLVINGDLDLGNNNNITVNNNGVLIVRGNLTLANKVDIAANAYIVVTGNLTKTGAAGQGSFTSDDTPSKVFIGGTISVPGGWASTGPTDVLNCGLTPEYTSSTCNYGNGTDVLVDPINDFIQTTCTVFATITTQPASTSVCSGANTSFTIAATGTNTYQWQVNTGSGYTNIANGGVYSNATTTTLNITGAVVGMNGYIYRCVVRNTGGCCTNSTGATLTVSSATPSPPTANAGSDATCTQITANWSSSAGATRYYLDVSTVNTFASFVAGYNNLNVNNVTSYNVTGLSAGNTYYYRVRAYNTCGTSGNSGTITYATSPATPAVPGVITGTANQCPGLTGQVYSISAVTNATTYTWTVPAGWSITAGAGTTSITVTTGSTGQNGSITVTAGNTCGTSAASSLVVTVKPIPIATISLSPSPNSCHADPVTITFSITGGASYDFDLYKTYTAIPAPVPTLIEHITTSSGNRTDNPIWIDLGTANTSVTYTYSITNLVSDGCSGANNSASVVVWVKPETGPQYHISNSFGY